LNSFLPGSSIRYTPDTFLLKTVAKRGGCGMNMHKASATRLFGTDYQQSVLRIVTAATHSVRAYTAYGSEAVTADIAGRPGFNGEVLDGPTRNYMSGNGYRAYSPAMMRFCRPDDQSPFGKGGLNAYGYCLADPINLRDPDGHVPLPNFLRRPLARVQRAVTQRLQRRPPRVTSSVPSGPDPLAKSPGGPSAGWASADAHVRDPSLASQSRNSIADVVNAPDATASQTPSEIARQTPSEIARQAGIRRMRAAQQRMAEQARDPTPLYNTVLRLGSDDLPNYRQAQAMADLYELPWKRTDIRSSS
jgi:RHS repeat-associated protein